MGQSQSMSVRRGAQRLGTPPPPPPVPSPAPNHLGGQEQNGQTIPQASKVGSGTRKTRSTSRTNMVETGPNNIQRVLECPVCFEDFGTKQIFQCVEGHLLCDVCIKSKSCSKNCPTCRIPMPRKRVRVRAMEFISGELEAGRPLQRAPQAAGGGEPAPKKPKLLPQHPDIVCDACGTEAFRGPRYKCLHCDDYDLCDSCWRNDLHSHHLFMIIPTPKMTPTANKISAKLQEFVPTVPGPGAKTPGKRARGSTSAQF